MKITKAILALAIGLFAIFAAIEGHAAVGEYWGAADEVVCDNISSYPYNMMIEEGLVADKNLEHRSSTVS